MQSLNDFTALAQLVTPKESKPGKGRKKEEKDFRAIFISDVHLGTKDCKANHLNEFLKHYSTEKIYLVGDIFDGWRMKSGIYWHKSFNRIIRRFLKLAKQGTQIYYITGNHDEFLRKWANISFDNIYLANRHTHVTADNKRLLVIHGDQFEGVARCTALLKYIGDVGYEFLMYINRTFNRVRARYGLGYWSIADYLKAHIKRAKEYIEDFEKAVAHGAKLQGFDGVICGHIHHPSEKEIEGVKYINTGDWVESCTAVVEDHKGQLQLIHWLEDPHFIALTEAKKEKILKVKARKKARKNLASGESSPADSLAS